MNVSDEFYNSFMAGGGFTSQECMCGRIYFCDPKNSHGDYEDGEYDRLLELEKENPKKYIQSEYDCISYTVIGNSPVVWDCPCGNDVWYERTIWNDRNQIMDYYKTKLEKMEKLYWDFADKVNESESELDSDEKLTYNEFLNKLRERKLKTMLV